MPVTSAASGLSAGTIAYFAASAAPAGFVKANGAAVSRTTYAALFLAIGTTYGAGDGSTTFNVPDLRGEFVRGLDDGRGVDSGRTLGPTSQAGAVESHQHAIASVSAHGQLQAWGTPGGRVIDTTGGGSYQVGSYNINATGGTETRPRNVALLACIKF